MFFQCLSDLFGGCQGAYFHKWAYENKPDAYGNHEIGDKRTCEKCKIIQTVVGTYQIDSDCETLIQWR